MSLPDPQFNELNELQHFIDLHDLDADILTRILDTAEGFAGVNDRTIKQVPLLRGKTVANLFFENSTRTRTAFELAAKRLSADALNIDMVTSSTSKGESLLDTLRVLESLQADMFVVRHADSGAAHFIARHVAPHICVINGGDGQHSHPTQGMLDMFTIRRVTLGAGEVRVVGPRTLIPANVESMGVKLYATLDSALHGADVIMGLRLQKERMNSATVPSSGEFYRRYGLSPERLALAKPDALVMHPGPTNRGVEIAGSVADGPQSVILEQVTYGIAVRMAVMSIIMGNAESFRTHQSNLVAQTAASETL